MKNFWRIFKNLFIIFFVLILHITVINTLPFPFSQLNIIFAALLFLAIAGYEKILWPTFILALFLESFSAIPFGCHLISLTLSISIMYWLLKNVFTNRSYYMVFLSAFLGAVIYRISFFLILLSINIFLSEANPGEEAFTDAVWEMVLTAILVFAVYATSLKFSKRLNPEYITEKAKYGQRLV